MNMECTPKKMFCPLDGSELHLDGDAGIVDYDGEWEAQASKYRCAEDKHVLFIVDPDNIEDPYDFAFEAAEIAIEASLMDALWSPYSVEIKNYLLKGTDPPYTTVRAYEDLRNELAKRAVAAFKDAIEEEGACKVLDLEPEMYEYIHALEDVDRVLESEEYKKQLEALGWIKSQGT